MADAPTGWRRILTHQNGRESVWELPDGRLVLRTASEIDGKQIATYAQISSHRLAHFRGLVQWSECDG